MQREITTINTTAFDQYESNVRSYCRSFPTVFRQAQGALLYNEQQRAYIDFFAGAGALNYGHNNPQIKQVLLEYLESDQIMHGLDMYTSAKRSFLERFNQVILAPRNLPYKVQFCGPTGANAVEAALKLARKVTGRTSVISFMGGYHGLSLGGLAVTGNADHRAAAGVPLAHTNFLPYPRGPLAAIDSLNYLETVLTDTHSGFDKPAAIILETIQAEGGIYVAPTEWLQGLRHLCDRHGIVLICDDIQVGCGRTGSFFSFEDAGIVPDLVTLSKSISGYGLPMALVLIKPEYDQWQPAEHTGTFRGNQLAFVGATAALDYWQTDTFSKAIHTLAQQLETFLQTQLLPLDQRLTIRGKGLVWGIDFAELGPAASKAIMQECFAQGLIIERVGRGDSVLKIMPPLTIDSALLAQGCAILQQVVQTYLASTKE
ncbi:diaminobutyrate--2-oxoglutarate transaminase [Herpetosiphon gulosus]|uniref:Diaminobutyrate--2-oxoglutarate transaminase n=1 Tax=Herpetosiphon gulosus TaxID=1973496 RepID=A0ABP9X8V3_9CHLR